MAYLKISGKTTSPFVQELRIAVPNTGNYANKSWDIRVRLREQDTVDAAPRMTKRTLQWESIAAVYSTVLGAHEDWRGLAWISALGKATDTLTGVPKITGVYDTKIISVPPASVFNPETREYTTAVWDGSYVKAFTTDPAWIINDAISDPIFGIAAFGPGAHLNKWDALEASKWFSQKVPNGAGGTHNRYSMNVVVDQPQKADEFVRFLAGAVGGFAWEEGNGQWRMKVDKPENPVAIFTLENIEGEFVYSHTDVDTRYNDITMVFQNEEFDYREDRVRIFDQNDINKFGRKPTSIVAVGCTNRQEAIRRGILRLRTSLLEFRVVTFVTNRQAKLMRPLETVLIADRDLGYKLPTGSTALTDTDQNDNRTTGRGLHRRRNWIRNSAGRTATGGTPATDTAPANWGFHPAPTGVTRTITHGSDAEGEFTDVRYFGTNNTAGGAAAGVVFETTTGIPSAPNEQIAFAVDVQLVAGSMANTVNSSLRLSEFNATGAEVTTGAQAATYGARQRLVYPRTNSANTATAHIRPQVYTGIPAGAAVDFTLRVRNPQLERRTLAASTYIRSTGTRADALDLRDTIRLEPGANYSAIFTVPNPNYNPTPATAPTDPDWKKPTLAREYNIVNTPRGDVKTINFDTALPDNLPEYPNFALKAEGLPTIPKTYRLVDITPSDGDPERHTITALEVDSGKYAAADNATSTSVIIQTPADSTPMPIAPAAGVLSLISTGPAGAKRVVLSANWGRPGSGFVTGFRVSYRLNDGPLLTPEMNSSDTYFEIPDPDPGEYKFEISTVDRRGVTSVPLKASLIVTSEAITNLLTYNDGTPIEDLRPAQKGADVTSTNTALNTANVGTQTAAVVNSSIANLQTTTTNHGTRIDTLVVDVNNLQTTYGSTASAADSATAAAAARDAAVVARTNAETASTAAATARDAASSHATNASTAATNSATARDASITARDAAVVARTNAETAATNAASARTAAQTAETNAVTAANNAGGHATTASSHKDAAAGSATNAAGSATTASTHAGNASTSAGQAATSATNAGTSASNAATSATTASNSSTTAINTVIRELPSDFLQDGTFWTNHGTGTPESTPPLPANNVYSFPNTTTIPVGKVLQIAVPVADNYNVLQRGLVQITPGRVYRFTATVRRTVGTSVGFRVNALILNGALTTVVGERTHTLVNPALDTWVTQSFEVTADQILAAIPTAGYIRWMVQFWGVATWQYAHGIAEDITQQQAAANSASAAANSATSASTQASNAGQSASAAKTSETNAATSAGNASTSASQASTSATNAAGSASTASTHATNAATSADNAGRSATAASTDASTASTHATNAGQSASAAKISETNASTSAGNASTSAGQASTSATNAGTHASTASTHATTAANSALDAGAAALTNNSTPGQAPGLWNLNQHSTLNSSANISSHTWASIVNGRLRFTDPTINPHLTPRSPVPVVAGRRYRLVYRVQRVVDGTLTEVRPYLLGWDSAGAYLGALITGNPITVAVANGLVTFEVIAGPSGSGAAWTIPANAAFIKPLLRNLAGTSTLDVHSVEIRDAEAELAAQGSASAAANSASTASTQATNAGTSASAAKTSETNANTSAGNASTSASQASTSATNAGTHASTASTHATVASTSARDAGAAALSNNTAPGTAPSMWNLQDWNTFNSVANIANKPYASVVGGKLRLTNPTENPHLTNRVATPVAPGRRYRMRFVYEKIVDGAHNLHPFFVGFDAAGNYTGVIEGPISTPTVAQGIVTWEVVIGTADTGAPWTIAPQTKFVKALLITGGPGTYTLDIHAIEIRDVEGELASAASASAAASSASTATTRANEAGQSATAAKTSETNASTSAGNASTSAGQASTSATNASGSASSAATSSTTAANALATTRAVAPLPDNFAGDAAMWFGLWHNNPNDAPLNNRWTFPDVGGAEGKVARFTAATAVGSGQSTDNGIGQRGAIRTYPGQWVRASYRVRRTAGAFPSIIFYAIYLTSPTSAATTTPEIGRVEGANVPTAWTTYSFEFQPNTAHPFLRLFLRPNPTDATAVAEFAFIRLEDITQAKNAADSASAASTSASNAAASRDTAGTHASAAQTSATNAQTAANNAGTSASNASTSAGQASTSATNASGSASTASSQATLASNSARDAGAAALSDNTAPGLATSLWNLQEWNVFNSSSNIASKPYASVVGGNLRFTDASETPHLTPRSATPIIPGRRYRFTIRYQRVVASAGGATFWISAFDSAGASLSTAYSVGLPAAQAANPVQTFEVTSGVDFTLPANVAFVKPLITSHATGTFDVHIMRVEDVEAQLAARGSADAAATSASTATTRANEAGTSASSANTSATNASTSASNAGTHATNASNSANTAATHASNASTSASQASTSATNASGSASNAATSATNAANSATSAGNHASAASTSASNASTSATNAGTHASSASSSANTAATHANNASSSASSASTSSASASNSASLALQRATLSAQLGQGASIVKNGTFQDWPDSQTLPTHFASGYWAGPAPTKTADPYTGLQTLRHANALNSTAHLGHPVSGRFVGGEWWTLEAEVTLNSGSLRQAGVLFRPGGSEVPNHNLRFGYDPDMSGRVVGNGTAGVTYRFRRTVQIFPGSIGTVYTDAQFYMINSWAGMPGGDTPAADITWHRVSIRPATLAEASVTTSAGAAVDVKGRTLAFWQVQTMSGLGNTATSFISARSETSPGSVTSQVALGAYEVHLYNANATGNFSRALSVVGGNVLVYGDLNVGGAVRVGSRRIAVALQAFSVSASDTQAISFGTDLGNVPKLEFDVSGLPALASGQQYDIKALSLTSTGFTMRAKIVTAGTSGNATSQTGVNAGGTPQWRADKLNAADSSTGYYSFSGASDVHAFGSSVEPGFAEVAVDCYVRAGSTGVWTKIGTIRGQAFITSTGTHRVSWSESMYFAGLIGTSADYEFGVHAVQGTIVSFNAVTYPTQTTSGGETSVAQAIPVRVIPQNQ